MFLKKLCSYEEKKTCLDYIKTTVPLVKLIENYVFL